MFGPEPDGATPVDPDEAEALIPSHIRTAYIEALQAADAGDLGPLFQLLLSGRPE